MIPKREQKEGRKQETKNAAFIQNKMWGKFWHKGALKNNGDFGGKQ